MKKETIQAAAGVFIRIALYTLLAYILEHGNIYTIDWKAAINAGVIGGIATLVVALNPSDPRFGYKKKSNENVNG